jgi:hypothetical protein
MKLKSLQTQYIQKSRLFLYPILAIKRGVSITPIQTYVSWEGVYTLEDYKLIGVYHLRNDPEFNRFEQIKLLKSPYFDNFFQLENDTGAYVFDFSILYEDYQKFINGKYSKFSQEVKDKILNFFYNGVNHHTVILSYLNPEQYMEDYAELLTVGGKAKDEKEYNKLLNLIKMVGEVCSLPDLNSETLKINKKNINFETITNTNIKTKEL